MTSLEGFDDFDGIELFQRLPIFRGLNFDETRRLAGIARPEHRAAGSVLVHENELGHALFIVKTGQVAVTKGEGGPETELDSMGPGELFGEMSLVDDVLTSAKVTAVTDVDLFVIPRPDFDELLAADLPLALKIYRAFCRTLSDKLRQLHTKVAPDAALPLEGN